MSLPEVPEWVPKDGAWRFAVTNKLLHGELGRCIDPEKSELSQERLEELRKAANKKSDSYVQSLNRPLGMFKNLFGFLDVSRIVPYHSSVQLTTQRKTDITKDMDYPDSHCSVFEYPDDDNAPITADDPHGCGLFRRSFKKLKKTHQCIQDKLKASAKWKEYRTLAQKVVLARRAKSRNAENPANVDAGDVQNVPELQKHLKSCETSGKCVLMDTIRRADEIMKNVGFKNWEKMKSDIALIAYVKKKIHETVSLKLDKWELEDDTVNGISKECFKLSESMSSRTEASAIKHVLPCLPLMWDQVEVSGAPEKPLSNAASMFDRSLVTGTDIKDDFPNIPPVCGRIALGFMHHPMTHTKSGKYSATYGVSKYSTMKWKDCVAPTSFNCVVFEKCWHVALSRACDITPGCCDTGSPVGLVPPSA
eukprot:gnl/MRDRNA2_/MRDRNA2_15305_c0_seq1.p1 gnl/MRDRNA2_/MRDRNA2_15305_c0~~gnl/MRDRNA2_/MRDRNA2_15305_c0_seq1.p1  ORF type:complete len:436 (-),score=62.89 gnl/MRDRNA2_/MRDRNA2_15305_c0_seq1:25-1287(-)